MEIYEAPFWVLLISRDFVPFLTGAAIRLKLTAGEPSGDQDLKSCPVSKLACWSVNMPQEIGAPSGTAAGIGAGGGSDPPHV